MKVYGAIWKGAGEELRSEGKEGEQKPPERTKALWMSDPSPATNTPVFSKAC